MLLLQYFYVIYILETAQTTKEEILPLLLKAMKIKVLMINEYDIDVDLLLAKAHFSITRYVHLCPFRYVCKQL